MCVLACLLTYVKMRAGCVRVSVCAMCVGKRGGGGGNSVKGPVQAEAELDYILD